jgi:hypothetical protein
MERGSANGWGLGIYVSPSSDYETAGSIEHVVVRRGDRVIQPMTTTVAPLTVGADGQSTKQLSRGFFTFPMDTLSLGADVTVILSGVSGEVTCTLSGDKLQNLR